MHAELVRELLQAATQGFLALPKRGIEIGGLLFGQIRNDQGVVVYEIASHEEIPCRHTFGPSYTLDDGDRKDVGEILARLTHEGSPPVIGIYRSFTSRDPVLEDGDIDLLQSFFPHRALVCLLIRPESVRKCDASVQFWHPGAAGPAAEPQQEHVHQPIHKPIPPPLHRPLEAREHAEEEPQEPVYTEREYRENAQPAVEDEARPRRWPGLLPLLCCVLAGLTLAAMWQLRHAGASGPEVDALALDAVPSAGATVLSWDRAKASALSADHGSMTVASGGSPSEIQLTGDQLQKGKLSVPGAGNASYRLRLYHSGRLVAADSLKVIRTEPSAPAPVASAPEPVSGASAAVARRQVEPSISPGIRARLSTPMTVPVTVTIDSTGRVTGASSRVKGKSGLERYLIDAAVQASRKWDFKPARDRNGEPVATTATLSFEFAPEQ